MARLPKACNPEANRRRPCRPLFHAAAFSLPWKGLERRGKLTNAVIAVLMTLNASQVKKPRKVAATPILRQEYAVVICSTTPYIKIGARHRELTRPFTLCLGKSAH